MSPEQDRKGSLLTIAKEPSHQVAIGGFGQRLRIDQLAEVLNNVF
jgi:hypothetical protein